MIQLIDIAMFLGIASTAFGVLRTLSGSGQTKKVNNVALVRRKVTVNEEDPQRTRGLPGLLAWVDRTLARVLERSNLRVAPTTALLLSVCLAIVHGVVALLLSASVWLVIVVCISTFCASLGGFYVLMTRRISMFGRQFPVAIELMARATRAGESLENAFLVAGNTSDDPLKSEFLRCVRQMQLGQTPVRATEDLAQRIHTTDLYLLADVLSMHMEVGGKLARSLERLAEIIRERAEFHEQMRSTTGIARFAVLAVTIIGLFVFIYMQTVQPEYLAKLAESSFGRKMIAYGVLSEAVGLLWVGLTLRSDF